MANSKRSVEKEEYWRSVLGEYQGSGLTIREFCRRKKISEPSFFAWRKEIARRSKSNSRRDERAVAKHLLPVDVVIGDVVDRQRKDGSLDQVEIVTPGGFTLRCNRLIEPDRLADLLVCVLQLEGNASRC